MKAYILSIQIKQTPGLQVADGDLLTAHTALFDHMPDVVGTVGMCFCHGQ